MCWAHLRSENYFHKACFEFSKDFAALHRKSQYIFGIDQMTQNHINNRLMENSNPSHSSTFSSEQEQQIIDKNKRLAQRGRWWLCAGIGFMALSFGANFLLFDTADHTFSASMYILTSLGTLCIVKSLADLLGF
jgi:hypothetical protein